MFKKLLHGKRKSALLNLTWSGLLCRVVWSVSQLLYLLQRAGHFKFFSPSFFVGLELAIRVGQPCPVASTRFKASEVRRGSRLLWRLFVKPIDKTGLADFGEDGIVDEGFRLRGLRSGMSREVEHGLHRGGGDQGQSFPCRQERLIGVFEIRRIGSLGILADHLFGEIGLRKADLDSF